MILWLYPQYMFLIIGLNIQNLAISELGQQMRDIKTETEYLRRVKEAEHADTMKSQAEDFQDQITALKTELRVSDEDGFHYQ